MIVQPCSIEGLLIAQPKIFTDCRGYFTEAFKADFWEEITGIRFLQDNESFSHYGTIRGLHFQKAPYAQTKLVRVLQGEIMDVALDLRRKSPTFSQYFSVILSEQNKKQFFIPKGFAHGLCVLSKEAVVLYKIDAPYCPEAEAVIRYNDPFLDIDWPVREEQRLLSEKDRTAPLWNEVML